MDVGTEKVGTALSILRAGLGPFVETMVAQSLRDGRLTEQRLLQICDTIDVNYQQILGWDVLGLLRFMVSAWNEAFRDRLSAMERSIVGELWQWRNRWAHQGEITEDDADRILDSIERLLRAVRSREAMKVRSIKETLRFERYSNIDRRLELELEDRLIAGPDHPQSSMLARDFQARFVRGQATPSQPLPHSPQAGDPSLQSPARPLRPPREQASASTVSKGVKRPVKKVAKKAVKRPVKKVAKKAVKRPVKKVAKKAVKRPATRH
jgi:hypothetical protein